LYEREQIEGEMMDAQNQDARILVVDDDKAFANNLVEFLTDLGYEPRAAYGGREGLAKFEQHDFQIVITDLMMPEMDGMALLDEIKKRDKSTVVMVITGYGTIDSAVQAIKGGAFDFIPKPLKLKEVEVIIKRALERHMLSRQLGIFRGLSLALTISVPFWLILGIILALLWKG
jgi:DNA-binding NtrC family response regulator